MSETPLHGSNLNLESSLGSQENSTNDNRLVTQFCAILTNLETLMIPLGHVKQEIKQLILNIIHGVDGTEKLKRFLVKYEEGFYSMSTAVVDESRRKTAKKTKLRGTMQQLWSSRT